MFDLPWEPTFPAFLEVISHNLRDYNLHFFHFFGGSKGCHVFLHKSTVFFSSLVHHETCKFPFWVIRYFLIGSADPDNAFTLLLFAWLRFSRFSALVSIACEDVFGSNKVGQKHKHWSHFRL